MPVIQVWLRGLPRELRDHTCTPQWTEQTFSIRNVSQDRVQIIGYEASVPAGHRVNIRYGNWDNTDSFYLHPGDTQERGFEMIDDGDPPARGSSTTPKVTVRYVTAGEGPPVPGAESADRNLPVACPGTPRVRKVRRKPRKEPVKKRTIRKTIKKTRGAARKATRRKRR